jgi:hypothetical protein
MKFFRLDLLTLLISLFILNSCKNQDTVGLGVNSSGQLSGSLVDTSTIVVNTVPEDSVLTVGLGKNPLAYFHDPIFGTTESSIATDLNLPFGTTYTLPTGTITIDSARLVLHYVDGFYGDSLNSIYTVNVYQLNEKYVAGTAYYNTKQWNVNSSNLLGSLTFNARSHDSIKIFNIITGKPDTLMKVPPQIRIPINPSFINTNLFNASTTTLSSNSIFAGNVKGLYITLDKTKSTGPGGILMFSPADSIAVYYKANNGTTIDTTVVRLPIVNMASTIKHTRSATIQTEIDNANTGSRNVFYLQGLAGLRTKISFPNLLTNLRGNLLKKDSDIVLNRAELVITPSPGSNTPYSPLPKITMYRFDIAHQHSVLEDASPVDPRAGGIGVFGGFYSPTKQNYHFIITAYLQDLLLNKTVDYGTYIAPVDTTNKTSVDYLLTPQVAARTIAVGSDKTSAYRIKLNIIYTKIKK